jgi:hypothetical protein
VKTVVKLKSVIGIVASVAVLVACDGTPGPGRQVVQPGGPRSTPSSPTLPAEAADPLEGEWLQTYTCEDNVRTFIAKMHGISAEHRRLMAETTGLSTALPGLIDHYIRDFAWGPSARTADVLTPEALCAGSKPLQMSLLVVPDQGVMVFADEMWDWEAGRFPYELIDNRTITLSDGIDLFDSPFRFRIEGDLLSFKQLGDQDPWSGSPPERAPFVRVS